MSRLNVSLGRTRCFFFIFGSLTRFAKTRSNLFDPVATPGATSAMERPGPPGPYMEGGPERHPDTSVLHLAAIQGRPITPAVSRVTAFVHLSDRATVASPATRLLLGQARAPLPEAALAARYVRLAARRSPGGDQLRDNCGPGARDRRGGRHRAGGTACRRSVSRPGRARRGTSASYAQNWPI
jgi:hypothetical protein